MNIKRLSILAGLLAGCCVSVMAVKLPGSGYNGGVTYAQESTGETVTTTMGVSLGNFKALKGGTSCKDPDPSVCQQCCLDECGEDWDCYDACMDACGTSLPVEDAVFFVLTLLLGYSTLKVYRLCKR